MGQVSILRPSGTVSKVDHTQCTFHEQQASNDRIAVKESPEALLS